MEKVITIQVNEKEIKALTSVLVDTLTYYDTLKDNIEEMKLFRLATNLDGKLTESFYNIPSKVETLEKDKFYGFFDTNNKLDKIVKVVSIPDALDLDDYLLICFSISSDEMVGYVGASKEQILSFSEIEENCPSYQYAIDQIEQFYEEHNISSQKKKHSFTR